MKNILIPALIVALASSVSSSFASDAYRITNKGCREYQAPKWFIDKYGANNGVVFLTSIKNTIVSEQILKSQNCDCSSLYQSWKQPIAVYEKDFKHLDAYAAYGTDTQKFLSSYRSSASKNFRSALNICKAQGVI